MVMFLPVQQELNCITGNGCILGKIKFDGHKNKHIFSADNDSIVLSNSEETCITQRLSGLDSGQYSIPMQDDD